MTTIGVITEISVQSVSPPEVMLDLPGDTVTVRELIDRKIRAEIQAWRDHRRDDFGREYGEWNVDRRTREVREEDEVGKALGAFGRGQFYVLVDGQQVSGLEAELRLQSSSKVRFIRIVPLAGG